MVTSRSHYHHQKTEKFKTKSFFSKTSLDILGKFAFGTVLTFLCYFPGNLLRTGGNFKLNSAIKFREKINVTASSSSH